MTIVFACFFLQQPAEAQRLRIQGRPTELEIQPPPFAGVDPQPDSDRRTRIRWDRPPRYTSKIMVNTIAPGQSFQLFTEAQNVRRATGMPEVELIDGGPGRDFIRDIRRRGNGNRGGNARVYFRAEAPASTGNSVTNGTDRHTVFFTWTAQ